MAEGNDAESRLRAATERLMAIPGEFAGRGVSGSHEKALAINEAELQARSEKVEALRDIQAAGLGPDPQAVQDAITREEAEIANSKRNIGRYGGSSS